MTGSTPGGDLLVECPVAFSFHTDPVAAVQLAASLKSRTDGATCSIRLDHRRVEHLDVCAGAVMMALAREAQHRGHAVQVLAPPDGPVLERLMVCGLAHVIPDGASIAPQGSAVLPLDPMVRSADLSDTQLDQHSGHYGGRVLKRLATWLKHRGSGSLSPEFRTKVGHALTETLDNVNAHVGSDWWVCADAQVREGAPPVVQIAVFNFGSSIYETMLRVPAASDVAHQIDWLVAEHQRRGQFGETWCRENLVTLFALQDAVTSRGEPGGKGTRNVIAGFEYLASAVGAMQEVQLGWTSGRTQVLLDGRYRMGPSSVDFRQRGSGLRDLALNPGNDLREAPDPTAVRNLPVPFPGTLLSLRFPVSPEYLTYEVGR